MPNNLLPLFVDVSAAAITVTGAGPSAVATARRLVELGASVRLVAGDLSAAREALDGADPIDFVEAAPAAEHVEGATLVIAASEDPAADADVLAAARERGILATCLTGETTSVHLGELVSVGRVAVAATTSSACPVLEARLARDAGKTLVPEMDALAAICGDLRAHLEERYPDDERRSQIWQQVLDSPVLALLQAGDEEAARELAERMAWGTG